MPHGLHFYKSHNTIYIKATYIYIYYTPYIPYITPFIYYMGRGGRFGRGVSLYRYRSQLFVWLWARFPLPTGQFSVI